MLRVLKLKIAVGLFENPYTPEIASPYSDNDHLEISRDAAEDTFVLLKNERVDGRRLLPLTETGTIALIGPLADSKKDMFGAWAAGADAVTLREALSARLGRSLIDSLGVAVESGTDDGIAEAVALAARADILIMALGERGNMSGEANSRSVIDLPGRQLKLLQAAAKTGKPVVLVLFSGRPLAIPWEDANIPAILEVWFPGSAAGTAIARALFGEINPSGKLPASFPRSTGQMPLSYNVLNTGRPAQGKKPGDGFITGYVDQYNTALFPFGWGLSYTEFVYSETRISAQRITVSELNAGASIAVNADITNVGDREGKETVQLYIRLRGTSVARPIRELKGFDKISLAPGEVRRVEFNLTKKELSFWNTSMQFTVERCELTVWIASSSIAGVPAKISIDHARV